MNYHNLSDIQKALSSGETTLTEIVATYLTKIRETVDLNIYLEVFSEEAIERATELQRKFETDPKSVGPLFGMVISIKDVICYKGHVTSASSKILKEFRSVYNATALQRALDADAIVIGRTNCDEFAMGSTNENSAYGPTTNGKFPDCVPGGSSGGAAVSVQMDTCLVALGSDTGGSIRQPAAFCGIYGFKPTYGRISRYGLIAYGSSFDQIGILGKDPNDIESMLSVIEGCDEKDATSIENLLQDTNSEVDRKESFAYFPQVIQNESIDSQIKDAFRNTIKGLRELEFQVDAIDFDLLEYLVPTYYVLTTAEASSNLSRYDGVVFGNRANSQIDDIENMLVSTRSQGFGKEVKRRIMMGSFVLSVGYYDAYFNKALKVRRLINEQITKIFDTYDFIIMPVSPSPPWKLGEALEDPVSMYLADVYTVLANLCGIPAISIPLESEPGQPPVGIQIMSKRLEDTRVLRLARQLSRKNTILTPL